MSGTYMNTDSRSETLNDAAAHDSGLYDPGVHDNQIVALYDTMHEANAAGEALVAAGVSSNAIQVLDKSSDSMAGGVDYESGNQGLWGAIKSLFVPDEDAHAYSHAIGRGHAMVIVSPAATTNREHVIQVLEGTNPIDFDAKLEEWRQSGYDYKGATASTLGAASAMAGGTSSTIERTTERTTGTPALAVTQAGSTAASPATTAASSTAAGDDTIKVMEERLRVGKREVANGAVRVRSYVVERPVEEQVHLHEETIRVERRPVDRAVTGVDATMFQDRTIEARATSEEAVVSKDVRVVEEIGLHKEATDRTETVHDTVRKTEVDVEDSTSNHSGSMGTGGGTTTSTTGATSSGTNAPRK